MQKNNNMKTHFYLTLLLCLLLGSCKQNKPTTANNTETDLSVQTQDTIAVSPLVIDSTLLRINEMIAEEFAAKNLKYAITEKHDTTTENYSYIVDDWYKNGYTRIELTIETFNSTLSAKQKLTDIQKMYEESVDIGIDTKPDDIIRNKIMASYFRINNKLYSFYSSANIGHIEYKIYKRIINEKQIKKEDTGVL
jgi:hypothetical protein